MSKRRVSDPVGPIALAIAAAALLGGCDGDRGPTETARERTEAEAPVPTVAARPDLSACPRAEPNELRIRTAPIAVPAAFEGIAASSMDHLAFTTLDGDTICVDTTWLESVDGAELSKDGRFASFSWGGYEAFGHVIVDRSGNGQVIDTGNPPVRSPKGERIAAVDLSESGFGSLNAFAVWDISPSRLIERARLERLPQLSDWRIDRWVGERCLELSGVLFEDAPEDHRLIGEAPRQRYIAREVGSTWRVVPAPAGGCPRA